MYPKVQSTCCVLTETSSVLSHKNKITQHHFSWPEINRQPVHGNPENIPKKTTAALKVWRDNSHLKDFYYVLSMLFQSPRQKISIWPAVVWLCVLRSCHWLTVKATLWYGPISINLPPVTQKSPPGESSMTEGLWGGWNTTGSEELGARRGGEKVPLH